MIEVFKTSVQQATEANDIVALLLQYFPGNKINIDLEDCDKVLRIEGQNFTAEKIIVLVNEKGYDCQIME